MGTDGDDMGARPEQLAIEEGHGAGGAQGAGCVVQRHLDLAEIVEDLWIRRDLVRAAEFGERRRVVLIAEKGEAPPVVLAGILGGSGAGSAAQTGAARAPVPIERNRLSAARERLLCIGITHVDLRFTWITRRRLGRGLSCCRSRRDHPSKREINLS